jgi:hypothetical protein
LLGKVRVRLESVTLAEVSRSIHVSLAQFGFSLISSGIVVSTKHHFIYNLRMGPISYSVTLITKVRMACHGQTLQLIVHILK